jgi:hypothetical protein
MTKETNSVHINQEPALARLVAQVRESHRPLHVRDDQGDVAALVPVAHRKPRRRRSEYTPEDDAAFLASAGGWKGKVDVDRLKEGFEESRRVPPRDRPDV